VKKNGLDKKKKGNINNNKFEKDKHLPMAYLAGLAGLSDAKIAAHFGVCRATISNWKNYYPEFKEQLKKGKDDHDDGDVIKSLFKAAKGYTYKEKEVTTNHKGEEKIKVTTKYMKPEPVAMIFWLKNRQRDKWKDRWEIDGLGDALKDGIKVKLTDGS